MNKMMGDIVQSYSGRKEMVFDVDDLESFLSKCNDGDKIRVESFTSGYKIPVDERYKHVLSVAEEVTGWKLTDSRCHQNTLIRSFVAYTLRSEGYSFGSIGKVMGRDHSTIIHAVRKMQDMQSVPAFYKDDLAMFREFERLLNEKKDEE